MKITKQNRRAAKESFRAAQINGVLDETKARSIVDEWLAKRPRGYRGTLSHFIRLVRLDFDRRSARIESVVPLDNVAQQEVRDTLTKRYGTGLDFTFSPNEGLIGGMRIKVGCDVFDGSIRGRLEQLQEA